MEKSFSTVEGC